ncbi:hypothetical protein ACLKA7_016341 [Drosophila subpalustris]
MPHAPCPRLVAASQLCQLCIESKSQSKSEPVRLVFCEWQVQLNQRRREAAAAAASGESAGSRCPNATCHLPKKTFVQSFDFDFIVVGPKVKSSSPSLKFSSAANCGSCMEASYFQVPGCFSSSICTQLGGYQAALPVYLRPKGLIETRVKCRLLKKKTIK